MNSLYKIMHDTRKHFNSFYFILRYEDMRSTSGSGGGTDSVWMNSGNHWKQQHSTGDKV